MEVQLRATASARHEGLPGHPRRARTVPGEVMRGSGSQHHGEGPWSGRLKRCMHEQVGTIGYGKDNHPPMDHDGYVAFIESCNQPDVSKVSGLIILQHCGQSCMPHRATNRVWREKVRATLD